MAYYNLLVLISFCAYGALAEWPPAEIHEVMDVLHETCSKKIGLTDAEIANYKIEDNSPKFMCYMKCLLVEYNWMKPDDTLDYDRIEKTVHESIKDVFMKALPGCKAIPDSAVECGKAYDFMKCLATADPVHWWLP